MSEYFKHFSMLVSNIVNITGYNTQKQKLIEVLNNYSECKEVLRQKNKKQKNTNYKTAVELNGKLRAL